MLLWNQNSIDPERPETYPGNPPEWLKSVLQFCSFWYSPQDVWMARTSGSTSEPKSIALPRTAILASAERSIRYFSHNPKTEGFALAIPAGSAGGFMLLARAFLAGMDVQLFEPKTDFTAAAHFPADKKWFISLLPLQFRAFLKTGTAAELSRKFSGILVGGGPLDPMLQPAIEKLECPVFHSYGMTETASHIAIRRIDSGGLEPFQLLDDVRIRLNANSCLEISSAAITGNKWLATRDIAEILPDGRFYILGRADFTINSGGLKIHPETEKQRLSNLLPPELQNFEMLGQPDEIFQEILVLIFFSSIQNPPDIKKIVHIFDSVKDREQRKRLPGAIYLLPEERPLLPGGKTDFSALKKIISHLEPVWKKSAGRHE